MPHTAHTHKDRTGRRARTPKSEVNLGQSIKSACNAWLTKRGLRGHEEFAPKFGSKAHPSPEETGTRE